jgi:hypothetical protein
MRAKQVWYYLPLPKQLRLAWDRITVSRLTTFYLVFSLVHCAVQVILQIQAFSINQQAAAMLATIVDQGNATLTDSFPVFDKDLRYCEDTPKDMSTESCEVIWSGKKNGSMSVPAQNAAVQTSTSSSVVSSVAFSATSSIASTSATSVTSSATVTVTSSPSATASKSNAFTLINPSNTKASASATSTTTVIVTASATSTVTKRAHPELEFGQIRVIEIDGMDSVVINGLGHDHENLTLSHQCLLTLNWPVMKLDNTKREDITFIAFQVWVLGMSIVAILNESIPHIIASLLTHLLATGWGAFQIMHTARFKYDFNRLTTDGACGTNLLSTYWVERSNAEIPALALNVISLLVSAFLSWRVIKVFGWQTFKRIGASRQINKIYKIVLSLSIVLQLAMFFVVASAGIWIDQLCNGVIGRMAHHDNRYRAAVTVVGVLLLPWLVTGWIAIRRENRLAMSIFLGLAIGYLAGWGAMFKSTSLRWTFVEWTFFSLIYTAGAVLVLTAFILGVWSRVNFGKGLPRYLNAEEPLPGDDFVSVTDSKPDLERSNTNYSYTSRYSEKVEFPSPTGPIPTFQDAYGSDSPRAPMPAYVSPTSRSPVQNALSRQDSGRSQFSTRSHESQDSIGGKKRWVIE